jgi:hypothetical protein
MDAELEQLAVLAQPLDRRARVRDEPGRAHPMVAEDARGEVDRPIGSPVDVDGDRNLGRTAELAFAAHGWLLSLVSGRGGGRYSGMGSPRQT